MSLFIPEYDLLPVHKLMLADNIRTHCYCRAIKRKTKNNSVIVDLGAGTGILSLAAAKAGAKKVYAIEKSKIIKVADKLINDNNLSEKIVLINKSSNDTVLKEKADLLVSEWMGVHVMQENMLVDFIELRDRVLKSNGVLIPQSVDIWLAPLKEFSCFDPEIMRWLNPVEGFDCSEVFKLSLNDIYIDIVQPENLAAEGKLVHTIDLYTVKKYHEMKIVDRFPFHSSSSVRGICGWFKANLAEDIILDTAPGSIPTHWQQTVYPIYPEIEVLEGESLLVELVFTSSGEYVHVTWKAVVVGRENQTQRSFSTKNNYTIGHL